MLVNDKIIRMIQASTNSCYPSPFRVIFVVASIKILSLVTIIEIEVC